MKEVKKDEDIRIFGYKLYADVKQNPMKVEDIPMSRDKWYETGVRVPELESWVRNEKNPKGILRLKIYSPDTPKINILANKKNFTAEELLAMSRINLVKLCESWEINTIRRKKAKLVELLMEKMTKKLKETIEVSDTITLTEDELNDIGLLIKNEENEENEENENFLTTKNDVGIFDEEKKFIASDRDGDENYKVGV